MKRIVVFLTVVAVALVLVAGTLPLRSTAAQGAGVPITPGNAAQVVELARFGRGSASGVTWMPDGSRLLVYGAAGVWLYDAADLGAQPGLISGYDNEVENAVPSADGTLIVTGTDYGTARVWDLAAGQEKLFLDAEGNYGTARAVISPDGTRIAMSVGDTLLLRDATTGEILVELKDAHDNTIVNLAYSPDGTLILTGSSDKTARLWEAATLAPVATLEGHTSYVNGVAFSPDGSRIVTGGSDKSTRLWDVATGTQAVLHEQERGNVLSVAFSPDGSRIATGNSYGNIRLFDAATLTELAYWEGAHSADVRSVAFSPDSARLAAASFDQAVNVWDVASGQLLASAPGHTRPVGNVALSPDGGAILAGSYDGTLRLWDLAGDDAHPAFEVPQGVGAANDSVTIASFSPDGTRVASIYSSTLHVWDMASGELLFEVGDYDLGSFYGMNYSPDGALIAVGTGNAMVLLWDAQTGDLLATLTGHTMRATTVIFSDDGALLISGGGDGTVRVWGLPDTGAALGIAATDSGSTGDSGSGELGGDIGTILGGDGGAGEGGAEDSAAVADAGETGDAAMSGPGTYVAEDGLTFSYPPEWVVNDDASNMVWVAPNQAALEKNVFDFTPGQDVKIGVSWGPAETMLRYATFDPATATPSQIADAIFQVAFPIVREKIGPEELMFGVVPVARIDGLDGDVHRLLFAFSLADGTIVSVQATLLHNDLALFEPIVMGIVATILADTPVAADTSATATPPADALALSETHAFGNLTLAHPAGWIVSDLLASGPGTIRLDSTVSASQTELEAPLAPGDVQIMVSWDVLEVLLPGLGLGPTPTPMEMMNVIMAGADPVFGAPYELMLGDRPAVGLDANLGAVESTLLLTWIENDNVLAVIGYTAPGELAQYKATIQAIAASVSLAPAPGVPPGATAATQCQNVAVSISDYSSQYSDGYMPANLLDNNPQTGWSSASTATAEYVVVELDGVQTVNGVLFNSHSTSQGYEDDSIRGFRIEVPDGDAGTVLWEGEAALVAGYQVYTFEPVTTNRLRFVFTTTYGGSYFEAADILVCSAQDGALLPPAGQELRQWALSAEATSQYSDPGWSALQATGAPNTPTCGDYETAWASAAPDGVETLTVYFQTPVIPQSVAIHQTYTPGSITGISLITRDGLDIMVPDSADPGTDCPGVLQIAVPPDLTQGSAVSGVRIYLDQSALGLWNEIDAVELAGITVGP